MGEAVSCSTFSERCSHQNGEVTAKAVLGDIAARQDMDEPAWLDEDGVVMNAPAHSAQDRFPADSQSLEKCLDRDGARMRVCLPAPLLSARSSTHEEQGFKEVIVSARQGDTLPRGPLRSSVPTFATAQRPGLSGEIRSGEVAYLSLGERIQRVWLAIYHDGFSVTPSSGSTDPGGRQTQSRAWSPFTLVETCQVQAKRHEQELLVFKLTTFRKDKKDLYYYFGCCGPNAAEERGSWMHEISSAIGRVSLSLIPTHTIAVRPVPGAPGTVTRVMAGYMMNLVDSDVVAVFYCELQAYAQGSAKIAMYQDEWCEHEVDFIPITATSVVSTRKGGGCTVLAVDAHLFCARTWNDKELWLRAVSNVKVKLMFDAPEPTEDELNVFRSAVLQRVEEDEQDTPRCDQIQADPPLLEKITRRRPARPAPAGDDSQPEPIDFDSPSASPRQAGKQDRHIVSPGERFTVERENFVVASGSAVEF
eukprot:TRINITY_DN289_c0_g2_i1.p1 TRINITY_DN289_c0_g2~~TRINITY_DN289_c0_g2_i1.p1  ORF type:complete len:503 (+),score=55.45 TRINITY_DN289_c0_g2_i1:82-1509(+)